MQHSCFCSEGCQFTTTVGSTTEKHCSFPLLRPFRMRFYILLCRHVVMKASNDKSTMSSVVTKVTTFL